MGPSKNRLLRIMHDMERASMCESRWGNLDEIESGFSFNLEDWKFMQKLQKLPSSEELDACMIHQLSGDLRRVEYIFQLSKALLASTSELLNSYTSRFQPISVKISRGLASLPDELLALILKFAVRHNWEDTMNATCLARVSRRFQRLVSEDRSLWTTLSLRCFKSRTSFENCVSRSGFDSNLDVIITCDYGFRSSPLLDFTDACSPYSSRWRSLTVEGDFNSSVNFDVDANVNEVLRLMMKGRRLELPRLRELNLIEDRRNEYRAFWQSFSTRFNDIHMWDVPNLKVVRCVQYIPPPSFPFTSFPYFNASLSLLPDYIYDQVRETVAFLGTKPNISNGVLDLTCPIGTWEVGEYDVASVVCPNITDFHLNVTNLELEGAVNAIGPIMTSLQMPRLRNLSIAIEISSTSINASSLLSLLGALIPDPNYHPALSSLIILIRLRDQDTFEGSQKAKHTTVDILLDKIPQVSTLFVTVPGRLSFFSLRPGKNQAFVASTSLRELELRSCDNLDIDGLQLAVQRLKDAGAWETLERVTIQDCEALNYDQALEVVGKERLRMARR